MLDADISINLNNFRRGDSDLSSSQSELQYLTGSRNSRGNSVKGSTKSSSETFKNLTFGSFSKEGKIHPKVKRLKFSESNFWAGDGQDYEDCDLGKITERSKESTEFDCLNSDRREFLLTSTIDKSVFLNPNLICQRYSSKDSSDQKEAENEPRPYLGHPRTKNRDRNSEENFNQYEGRRSTANATNKILDRYQEENKENIDIGNL